MCHYGFVVFEFDHYYSNDLVGSMIKDYGQVKVMLGFEVNKPSKILIKISQCSGIY